MNAPHDLRGAFVAAFPAYVEERLAALDIAPPPGFDAAVAEGAAWLDARLAELLGKHPALQRRSPLELFQQALEPPTRALAAAGVPEVPRDPVAINALPGDVYDLAPATSQVLGEAAWRAHVAWGIEKAEAVVGVVPAGPSGRASKVAPLVVLFGIDLMDRTRIAPVAEAAGFEFAAWRNPGALAEGLEARTPAVVLVDLTHAAADDAIRACTAAGVRTIGFGPHVDDVAMGRARSLGAIDAVSRSRFFSKLDAYLQAMT